jgi:general secretion pathway protein G
MMSFPKVDRTLERSERAATNMTHLKEKEMQTIRTVRHMRRRRTARGLTLVEMMVVIALIGVLTAAIAIGVVQAQKRASIGAAKTACNTIRDATIQWRAVHPGDDCPTVDQLKKEKILDTGFNVKDPWNSSFKLGCDADEITCTSAGPDRKEGTEDDIQVPQVESPGPK